MGTYPWAGQQGTPQAGQPQGSIRRLRVSRGLKFVVVCGLALGMSVLAAFVAWLTGDRSSRAEQVRLELSSEAGGPQIFLGPTMLVPYTEVNAADTKNPMTRGVMAFAAANGSADVHVQAEERRRSLYRVPVFTSEVSLESQFAPGDLGPQIPATRTLDWSAATIAVGVSNAGAALSDAVLLTPDGTVPLRPIAQPTTVTLQASSNSQQELTMLGVNAAALKDKGAFAVRAQLHFRGAQRVTVLPHAQSTRVTMQGNWADPGFTGATLPLQRSVTKNGFTAEWFVPGTARNTAAAADVNALGSLLQMAPVTNLVEVTDPYQSVERALKYAPLFLGLVFLSYFLFEMTAKQPVHVAQYVLVGVAQLVFYLLLLSFAERTGFDWAYLLGGGATVLLLSMNAGWVFRSTMQRRRSLIVFSALYAMIYGLLRLEDNALLFGALGSFAAIAAAMYFTRKLDWYGEGGELPARESTGLSSVNTNGPAEA